MYLDEKEKGYYDAQQRFWLDQNTFIKEAVQKALEQGELNGKIEIAKKMLKRGTEIEIIAEDTRLTIEQIKQLRNETKKN
jgi:predicted transposase/invertase (TIGR01784 family)